MIRKLEESEYDRVLNFIKEDNARNYFIRLGFESKKTVYEEIIGEFDKEDNLKAVLLKRKSGNLQFYAKENFNIDGFSEYISKMDFSSLISPSSYCDKFLNKGLFSKVKDGAIIARLSVDNKMMLNNSISEVETLKVLDLDEVVNLYEQVFTGFTSKSVMKEKLLSNRGRGVCIRKNGKIVSIAQSEFEDLKSAIIVGVATEPELQGLGLGSKCLEVLCNQLLEEGKDLYLQYDNMDAGRIYERIGFKPIDKVKHYIK